MFSIGQSDESKSNKISDDYFFLHALPYGGGVSEINGITLTKFNAYTAVDQLLQ